MTPTTESMDRSECLVKYPLFKTAIARIQACFDSHNATAEPDCCPIVGESGSGKTTIIAYFASLHPRVDHKWGLEVPVLVAKVPARPTVKSFAETLLYQLGDPLWSHGNTVKKSIRLRELLKRCRVRLLALDEFQHFVDVRQANILNDVADWLKEQVEEARLSIVVAGLPRCLEVLRQNEQLRRRFGATLRVGAFRWDIKEDRTTYRAFLRAVKEQLPEYDMPDLSDVDMAFRVHYASYGLIGYTMKIIRGAARIARSHPRRQITLRTLSQSFSEHVWSERLEDPNPFTENFDSHTAPPVTLPSARTSAPHVRNHPSPSKLVRAAEIQRFAEQYVSATVLGRRFNINGTFLARYLKESGTPLLAVRILGREREHARFLLRDVAARLPLAQIQPKAAHEGLQSAEGVGRSRRRPIGFCQ